MSNTKRWTCRCVKGCSNQTLYPKKKQQRRKPKSTNKSLALQLFDFSCEWVMCGDSSPPHLEFACEWVVWRRVLNVDDSSPPHLEFSWEWVPKFTNKSLALQFFDFSCDGGCAAIVHHLIWNLHVNGWCGEGV